MARAGRERRAARPRGRGDRALGDAGDPVHAPGHPRLHDSRHEDREGQTPSACSTPSGNRDEEIFADPFQFRIDRSPNDHVGFGRGEHVCLGAHLARLELRTVFEQLRERLESFERTGPAERVRSSFVGGIKRAPIRWTLRNAAD